MSGGGSKTTSSNTVDPQLMQLYQQNYAKASDTANTPYTPFTGEMVAGQNDQQKQAGGILSGLASGNQSTLQPFMNPFQQNVIDATMSQIGTQRGQAQVADNQAATAAHAFGGSRQGVADALTNQKYDQDTASTLAGLNSQNFAQAQTGALNTANGLSVLGGQQQQTQTAQDQAAYQEFLRQITFPQYQQQQRNAALGMIPMQQTQNSSTSNNSGVGGILGSLGQLGLAAAMIA